MAHVLCAIEIQTRLPERAQGPCHQRPALRLSVVELEFATRVGILLDRRLWRWRVNDRGAFQNRPGTQRNPPTA